MILWWTLACSLSPYPEYWPDKDQYPVITGTEPTEFASRVGGERLVISGRHLSGTRTVVVGGMNAEIVSVDDRAVTVQLPALPAGPDKVAISLATGKGASTMERALRLGGPEASWWSDETASAALYRVDCPVEGMGWYVAGRWAGTKYPMLWCGYEMGWASADGFVGTEGQPGFAGELSGLTPLAQLPPVGEARVIPSGHRKPPGVPLVFGYHTAAERIDIVTERDFARDLAFVTAREDLLWETYYWWDSIEWWLGPNVTLFDDETCRLEGATAIEAQEDTLYIDGDATDATGIWLGYGIEEADGYTYDAYIASAPVDAIAEQVVVGAPSGAALAYDAWSGWFAPETVSGLLGQSEVPGGVDYIVDQVDAEGVRHPRGTVMGGSDLDLYVLEPDLMTGKAWIALDEDFIVRWNPGEETTDPTFLAIEIVVYDMEIDDPNWQTEVARLVARGDDAAGELVLPASLLSDLPLAPNNWTVRDEFKGYWGDMTIARHQLRKVATDDGDLVMDFVHAVNGPVRLRVPSSE